MITKLRKFRGVQVKANLVSLVHIFLLAAFPSKVACFQAVCTFLSFWQFGTSPHCKYLSFNITRRRTRARWLQIVWYSIHNPPTCPSQPVTVRLSISICETIATEHLLRTPTQKPLTNHHLRHRRLRVATSYLQIIILVPSQQPSPHSKHYCHIRDGHIETSSEKRCCLYRSLFKSTICN